MLISITRLKLRRAWYWPAFIQHYSKIVHQLKTLSGYMGGQTGLEGFLTYWTVTGWADEAAMKQFRNHGAHGSTMPKLLDWCDEAAVARTTGENLPTLEEAYAILREHGRISPVRNPSPRHAAGHLVPDHPHFYHGLTRAHPASVRTP